MTKPQIPDEARDEARQWLRAILEYGENQDEDRSHDYGDVTLLSRSDRDKNVTSA
jgi:hypothetical protein